MAKKTTRKKPTTTRKATKRAAASSKTASGKRRATRPAARTAAARTKPAAKKKPGTTRAAATAVRGALAGAVAAVTRHLPGAPATPDAITLLETDHRRMEEMLDRGEQTGDGAAVTREELLKTITTELQLHELIEEKILYPALKAHPEGRAIVLEGFQEHHVADLIVNELHGLSKTDERWGAKFKVLKENIEHHIDEEEGEMFRTARAVFTQQQLQEMGMKMARMKALAQRSRRRA